MLSARGWQITYDTNVSYENHNLNEEQGLAVTYGGGPLLVMAGAGSGKTKVLVHRVSWLIKEKGVDPGEIVLLTFTNKAAGEMKERVDRLGDKKFHLGFAGTFHTFCAKMLRSYGANVGVRPDFVIFDSDDSETVMKQVMKELNIDSKETKPGMFMSVISKMKNDLVTETLAEENAGNYFYRQVAKVWRAYSNKLKQNNAVDFDDLLTKTVELLSIQQVRDRINQKYKWVLVDEYQDTNKAQFELTKLLAGKQRNLTAVGDASQAIYSFRGADYRNLLLLASEYPDLKTIGLPKNYRSTQMILDAAYGVVKHNTNHPTIKLEATMDEGKPVEIISSLDEMDEARLVADRCRTDNANNNECAILYRTNAQSRAIEEELIRRDIPYRLIGGLRFYNRAEIKDLIAYLRLINNPHEELSRTRIEKIGKRKAAAFENWRTKLGENLDKGSVGSLLEEIINQTGYLDKFDDRDEEDRSRIENINELLAVASEFKTVEEFLESAALAESEIKQSKSSAMITLMTVHAAKGLEFDCVYVTGLEEGIFPHSRSIFEGGKEELEEERRLMYVAMTRSKMKLTLTWARSRLAFGGRHTSIPSRFLAEIPENVIEKRVEDFKVKPKNEETDIWGDKRRIIVQDWEVAEAAKDDFADIDNW